jgi:HEAT repeat protein
MQYLVPDPPEEKLRHWWLKGDAVLRRHALLSMDAFDCPDIVLAVASDAAHPLHAEAVGQMTVDFDRAEYEDLKITALAHADPRVRETAAAILFWDEPVLAERPLIEATRDSVPAVVAEACKTLQYYPSLRTARCLHRLLDHSEETVREEARQSFGDVRHEFLLGLRSRDQYVARHVRHWLELIWGPLASTEDELRPDPDNTWTAPTPEPKEAVPLANLLRLFGDPDASPKALQQSLWRTDWQAYAASDRERLRPVLLEHPDPLVREQAVWACGAWQDANDLLALVRDVDFGVRKAAMHRLGELPPTPGIADLAWEHLHRRDALGVHATETLETFVRHAGREVAVRRLGLIAGDHGWREGLRTGAVYDLARLGAVEELSQLTGQLLEPPEVTWSLHIALLGAAADMRLSLPDIGHLRAVDNLHVQEAVARFDAG